MSIASIWQRFFSKARPITKRPPRVRLAVEELEERAVPASYVWTNGTGDGMWATAANWTDTLGGPSAVPGSIDTAIFGSLGSNTPATMNIPSLTINALSMDSDYTSTLTIAAGNALDVNDNFVQYGTLSLGAGATVNATTYYLINGTVTTTGFGSAAALTTTGDFTVNTSGAVTLAGMTPPLNISSGSYYDNGAINIGGGANTLTITGAYVQEWVGAITVADDGTLAFVSGGIPGDYPIAKGTISLDGTITTGSRLDLHGAKLTAMPFQFTNTISGDVFVYNGGDITIGASGLGATLTMPTGSLTIGSSSAAPNAGATGGTLNVLSGSTLSFPSSGGTDTFVVTKQGVVNMYGATISMDTGRIAAMQLYETDEALLPSGNLNSYGDAGLMPPDDTILGNVSNAGAINVYLSLGISGDLTAAGTIDLYGASLGAASLRLDGKLTTHGDSGGGDSITLSSGAGTFTNNGTLVFAGSLHTLALTGNYVQGSTGLLEMRLADGPANDVLSITGTATLDGTLKLTGSVADNQLWTIIGTGGGIGGAFANIYFPDGNPNWIGALDANNENFEVQN